MVFRSTFAHTFAIDAGIATGVFVAVILLLVVSLTVSARRKGAPSQALSYRKAELVYVGLVAAAAGYLVTLSFTSNAHELSYAKRLGKPAVNVAVTAFQWCWDFKYLGTSERVDGTCIGGRYPVLVVPTGKPVQIDLTSTDVVHNMWIPHLRFKLAAFPDHVNKFRFTIDKKGRWMGHCAEFCGIYHYTMLFWLEAVSPADFRHFISTHELPAGSE